MRPNANMPRKVTAELLDELPVDDPGAVESRCDLRLINLVMGNHRLLAEVLSAVLPRGRKLRLLDLATGDGTQMLRVARLLGPVPAGSELVLVDQHDLVARMTRNELAGLGWSVSTEKADILRWTAQQGRPGYDAIVANLFLHHLADHRLGILLEWVARCARSFAAIEPHRDTRALLLSRLVGLIGCNRVTRKDAVASVRGGFAGRELSGLWPGGRQWRLQERSARLASHVFVATKNRAW